MEEAFLLIFSIVGLLPCGVNSILEGSFSKVELDSLCTGKSLV